MTWIIPETADAVMCPFARTFSASVAKPGCRGPLCALWRWEKIMAGHPVWRAAVQNEGKRLGEGPPFAKAARAVADNPEAFGLTPVKGFCGAGGQP